jgi:hypothetical protein
MRKNIHPEKPISGWSFQRSAIKEKPLLMAFSDG